MASLLQLVRGASLTAVLGALLQAVGLIVGITTGSSILLFPIAAVAGMAFVLIPDSGRQAQALGAVLVGAAAGGFGVVTGFGSLEVATVAGGLAAATALLLIRDGGGWRVPFVGLAIGALALVLLNLVPLVLDGGGLNHDESAYALKAKHWLYGTPETGWGLHRGVAMSAYGYIALSVGGEEPLLRVLGLVAIVGYAGGSWALASAMGRGWVGPIAGVAAVSGPAILRRATEYLSDIPSSALLLVCMTIVWWQFGDQRRPTYRLLWLLPVAWLAFYIRYKSVLSFGLIGVAILVLWWGKVRERPGPAIAVALLGLTGLIPHFMFASSETGSPLGILTFTGQAAGREFYGEGLVDYAMLLAWPLAGFVGPLAFVLFFWWLGATRSDVSQRTRALFLAIPAVGQVLLLGVVSHGEPRFVFFPLALTVVGAMLGLQYFLARSSGRGWSTAAVGLSVVLIGSLALSIASVRRSVEGRILATQPVELSAESIEEASLGSCGAMTSYLPQITFYSECFTAPFRTHLEPDEVLDRIDGDSLFMVLIEDGKRQPEGEELDDLIEITSGDPVLIEGDRDSALVFEFQP